MRRFLTLILFAALPGCTTFPDIDIALASDDRAAARPDILPIADLVASVPPARLTPESGPRLAARAAWLRQRARALSGPVLTERERRKLQQALLRHQRER